MAKPLNIAEHNASFIKYLIFFILTLTMAVCAIYFNFKIPNKELKMLRKRSDLLRIQQTNQENYKRTLNEVMTIMNSLDSGSNSKAFVNSDLDDKLSDLKRASNIDDSSASQRLNQVIFRLVNEYRNAKFKLYDCKNCSAEIADRDVKISNLKVELKDCSDKLGVNAPQN